MTVSHRLALLGIPPPALTRVLSYEGGRSGQIILLEAHSESEPSPGPIMWADPDHIVAIFPEPGTAL